jgi:hypothetical protein
MSKTCQNGKTTQTYARTTILIIRPSQTPTSISCHVKTTPFSDLYLVHEMSLRQKGTYAPPQDKARGINIHDGK